MKIRTSIAACIVLCSALNGQTVTDIQIAPASPTSNDDIKAVVTATFPGGPCSLEAQQMTQSNDTIIISGFYCYQSGTGGCTSVDTFSIGLLPAGSYTVRLLLYTSNTPAPCGSAGYFLKNIGLESFSVSTATGVIEIPGRTLTFYPNPAPRGNIVQSLGYIEAATAEIKVFSLNGSIQKELTLEVKAEQSVRLETAELPEGIYFCVITTSHERRTGKFAIAK
ncbi:MAG TPA: T9SS type A sorting domain-containing protein [Chitinophagales bacterium]|nr:T9SS type A sorting domain-containing protein [Chitinophagales bacterium]